ncbi:helix-turn-helix transcriptional regulator [Trueperella pyogenes]|uniref:helix-turn-helix domain-containing protein n=1 Tax=Trueperella pyogenes TaxID=1661 RepID=UPI0024C0C4BC|nr:helix-turn-helix transcriptional regulator [Trueperella pyogenes]WHU60190.1 helix-turn-helix transcriptional regulator [Trueperella pyogenes]
MRIENQIKAEAVRAGVQIKDLATAMGTSRENLSRSFSGRRDMRTSEVVAAAEALGVDLEILWARATEQNKANKGAV